MVLVFVVVLLLGEGKWVSVSSASEGPKQHSVALAAFRRGKVRPRLLTGVATMSLVIGKPAEDPLAM